MKKLLFAAVLLVVAGVAVAHWYFSDRGRFTTAAQYTDLDRTVTGNDLLSMRDPEVLLSFNQSFRYIGGQKFILYGVADTEQHFFVQTTADNILKSLYWVQFEAYLPGKRYTYNYDHSPLRVMLGDYEFFTDTEVFEYDPDKKRKSGTDGAMVRAFLASKGLAYPAQVNYARLVYLTDASRQKELMIIFMDDLASSGLQAADLQEGGAQASRRNEFQQALLSRIQSTLTVRPYPAAQ